MANGGKVRFKSIHAKRSIKYFGLEAVMRRRSGQPTCCAIRMSASVDTALRALDPSEFTLPALPEEIANLQAFAYMTKSYLGGKHDRQDNP